MPIKVFVDSIDSETIQKIMDYYNANKSVLDEPIERLNRAEGGFKINFRNRQNNPRFRPNEQYRQLRWERRCLVSGPYIPFMPNEEKLLYDAFVNVMGEETAKIEP